MGTVGEGAKLDTAMTSAEYTATAEGRTTAFRPAEIAARWGCSRAHVYHLIERGELKSFRAGTLIRIPAGEVARIEAGNADGSKLSAPRAVRKARPKTDQQIPWVPPIPPK